MGRHVTCGWASEIKKRTNPENVTALLREQANSLRHDRGSDAATFLALTGLATAIPSYLCVITMIKSNSAVRA